MSRNDQGMTRKRAKEIRDMAQRHGGRSGEIILELLAEVERCRRELLRRGLAPVGVLEEWPYGEHRGKPFHEVPEDYLRGWMKERTKGGLEFDIDMGTIAERDLQLFNLITRLDTKPETPNATTTDHKDQDPLPDQEPPSSPPDDGQIALPLAGEV